METMLISTAVAGATRAAGEASGTAEMSAAAPGSGAEAFIAALLAQGMSVPAGAAPTLTDGAVASGKDAPPAEPVLPLVRPPLAAAPTVLRRAAPADDKTAAVAEKLVADGAETTAALELDDALAGLRTALAGKGADAKPVTRMADVQATPATPIAAAVEMPAELAAAREAFTGAPDTGAVTGAQGGARSVQPGSATHPYAARPAQLPLAEPDLFAERLTQQISVMVSQHSQQARIAVSPPDLGPVEVRVVVQGDEATIQLAAPHVATREALEEALPRLRAAFADSGLSLGQTGVFAEMPQREQQAPAMNGNLDGALATADEGALETAIVREIKIGLVDAFV